MSYEIEKHKLLLSVEKGVSNRSRMVQDHLDVLRLDLSKARLLLDNELDRSDRVTAKIVEQTRSGEFCSIRYLSLFDELEECEIGIDLIRKNVLSMEKDLEKLKNEFLANEIQKKVISEKVVNLKDLFVKDKQKQEDEELAYLHLILDK